MLFRQGALVVLAGTLPLAAAGTLTPATRPWFKKVTGWMMALIFYKPCAAAVYAAAFTMAGTGKNLTTILAGLAMIALSLVALPALMRFFTWTTGQVENSSGGGFMQTALSSVTAIGAMRGYSGGAGGAGAADQARRQAQQLGPADGGGTSGPRAPAGATAPASPAPAGTAQGARTAAGVKSAGAAKAASAAGGPWAAAASVAAGAADKGAKAATDAMQHRPGQRGGQ